MKMDRLKKKIVAAGALLLLAGCALPGDEAREELANSGWQPKVVETSAFDLQTAQPEARYGQTMWIYLEGDGAPYITPEHPSWDPTPDDPIGLRLAIAHPGNGPVAYIARPCQYVLPEHDKGCEDETFWTSARYAPEVIKSTNAAIDAMEAQSHAQNVVLVGYAGGGSLAVLTAATRQDVIGVITIASNLDLNTWVEHNDLTPLMGSRNPSDVAARIATIPQIHFAGAEDHNVDPEVLKAYMAHLPPNARARVIVMEGYTHKHGWVENWGDLFRQVVTMQYLPFNRFNILPPQTDKTHALKSKKKKKIIKKQ